MGTATLTLTDFLSARIAEDEAVARAVIESDYSDGHWRWELHRPQPYRSALVNDREAIVLPPKNDDVFPSAAVADHIARHDPTRALAECEAKRRIVELHEVVTSAEDGQQGCVTCDFDDEGYTVGSPPCETVLALAAIYADHPGYRDEWHLDAPKAPHPRVADEGHGLA